MYACHRCHPPNKWSVSTKNRVRIRDSSKRDFKWYIVCIKYKLQYYHCHAKPIHLSYEVYIQQALDVGKRSKCKNNVNISRCLKIVGLLVFQSPLVCLVWSAEVVTESRKQYKISNHERWSLTGGPDYGDLTGKYLTFCKRGRLREMVAHTQ